MNGARWLSNDVLSAGLAPALGGRLLALRLGKTELLHRNDRLLDAQLRPTAGVADLPPVDGTMASWRNWGGDKTWPAPQGWGSDAEWQGPPDPVLDGGAYELSEADGAVIMRSAPDLRTGVRITRTVRLDADDARLRLGLTFENVVDRAVRWAIWNVTQLPGAAPERGDDGVFVGVDDPAAAALFAATGTPRHAQIAPGVVHVPPQDVVGKLGFPGAIGWLAHAADGFVLTQRWPVWRDAPYPDQGSRAEVWLEHPLERPVEDLGGLWPSHRVVEVEALGPLAALEPGETTALEIDVGVCAAPAPIVAVGPHGCISRPLIVAHDGRALRIEGCAGTFVTGGAELAWLDGDDRTIAAHALGDASPRTPVCVSAVVAAPRDARAVALRVAGHALDRAELP